MDYSEPEKRKEGKKKVSCCFEIQFPHLKHATADFIVSSRPPVLSVLIHLDICVHVPRRLVAEAFGVLDTCLLKRVENVESP